MTKWLRRRTPWTLALVAALACGQEPQAPPQGKDKGKKAAGDDNLFALFGNPYAKMAKDAGGKEGPFVGRIGNLAEFKVPAGVWFVDQAGADKFMRASGNLPGGVLDIAVFPHTWMVFQFDDRGFVKDADKEKLDADQLLKDLKSTDEPQNRQRKAQGLDEMFTDGWEEKPFYDPETKNLVWGLRVRGSRPNDFTINYDFRVLGRRGVMACTLVGSKEDIAKDKAMVRDGLVKGYEFTPGNKYAEFQQGDKVAEYGLAALIAGGGVAAAAKLGLLGKLGAFFAKSIKLVLVAVVAVFAGIAKLFGAIFGRKKTEE